MLCGAGVGVTSLLFIHSRSITIKQQQGIMNISNFQYDNVTLEASNRMPHLLHFCTVTVTSASEVGNASGAILNAVAMQHYSSPHIPFFPPTE